MKKLQLLFLVLFAVCVTAHAQTFTDNFSGLNVGVNLAGQSSWTKGGSGPELTVANTTPLTYPGYNSGGAEYAVIPAGTTTSARVYKTFTAPKTNLAHTSFYYSVLLRLTGTTASSNGYFMSLGNSGAGTQYGAKLFARTSGSGYNIGLSKTSNTATFGASVLSLNTTYLVVVRYSFNNPGSGVDSLSDDEAYLWINPIAKTEPAIGDAECIIPSGKGGTDYDGFSPSPVPYDVGNFVWHTRNATNPVGAFDGVKVGYGVSSAAAWADLNPGLATEFDDPASLVVQNTKTAVTVDGKLDEADWATAPTLVFGKGAFTKKQAGENSVTGGVDVKSAFDVNGVKYFLPNKDSSVTRVKFMRKGTDLFIGLQSTDKSICKFDWEADGLFLIIKNSAGVDKQYKLYYQNIDSTAKTMRLEEDILNSSAGAGVLNAGSSANDTTNVDNGYTAEFKLKLGSLGFDANTTSLQLALNIFDPDGFQFNAALPWPYGMMPFDSARGSYYKSWWGSEWGGTYRTLTLAPETIAFDDPAALTVKNTSTPITIDGKLDEADWNGAPTLIFGNGASLKKQPGEFTVTSGADVKASFDVNNVTYHVPNTDSSVTRVKFLRKGTDLVIGLQSNDKSICKFDWEADGLLLFIKNAAGVTKQYKLYYQNIDSTANTARYEEDILNSGQGVGYLFAGSKANDTTQVDHGFTAELRVKLASLGFDANTTSLQIALDIFDPDGFQFNSALQWPFGMMPFDSARGSYYKSWWGSEWGDKFRTLNLVRETPKFDDPPSLKVKNTAGIVLDGKLDDADWAGAPTLIFGNGAQVNKQGGEFTVTGEADVKASFDVNGVTYHKPNTDSSTTRVKFLRKGTDLYIGFTSNDKSICKFDWEGDGLFLMIKNSAGVSKQYKLYYQNIDSNANTIRYEEDILNSGQGFGYLFAGSKVNDTTQVDAGYSGELRVKLASLGYDANVSSLQLAMNIFDPDGIQYNAALPWPYGMMPFDSARGSYFKSWWGSEWGDKFRTLTFEPEKLKFDDPKDLLVKNATGAITVDGKLDEADWNGAPTLLFGNGAFLNKQGGDNTVTGEADVKAAFDVNGTKYFLPNTDSSQTRVKFLRKGTDLYVGFTSNDKSICKFDWEGDGLFLMMKNSAGVMKQFKLYYQNPNDTIRYEEDVLNSGQGAGFLFAGSKVNDTTQVDAGYSGELRVKLPSLGFDANVSNIQVAMNIFDPDGFQHPMNPWDSARGTYYKSWWGSEWGDQTRTLRIVSPYDNPDTIATVVAAAVTLDGKLNEPEWALAPTLVFGPPNAVKTGTEKTVTGGADVKASFDVNGVTYHLPYKDTSFARVKFMQKGMNLFIGITSPDKSICKFDWEGDGMFLMIKNAAGVSKQYKLYYQNPNDTIRYEEDILNSGAGAGYLFPGSKVNDTTQVDAGYSAELQVKLASLGFDATVKSLQVALNVFDPDGYQHPMAPWDSARGSYFKSWWGSEWGDVFKTIKLQTITSVNGNDLVPTVYALSQNYPNPFNPTTNIKFSVPLASVVTIVVYDIIGREVATIANGNYSAGYYTVSFNAEHMASGMYMYRMTSTSLSGEQKTYTNTKKLMLVK
jgi:hypothetical protein